MLQLTEVLPKAKPSARKTALCGPPFIGPNLPFVGRYSPPIIPFVGHIIPSVCIRRVTGFTLVELLITVVIIGILAAAAAPSFSSLISDNRMTTSANDMIGDMLLARAESVRRNQRVVICKSSNPTNATPACNTAGSDWTSGWIVFVDVSNDQDWDAGETILRVHTAIANNITLSAVTSNLDNFLIYRPSGRPPQGTGAGTLKLCDSRGAQFAKAVVVTESGRPLVYGLKNGSGITLDSTGAALTCP